MIKRIKKQKKKSFHSPKEGDNYKILNWRKFLSEFVYPVDRERVKEYRENIIKDLREASLNILPKFHNELQKTKISLWSKPATGDPNYETSKTNLMLKIAILEQLKEGEVIQEYILRDELQGLKLMPKSVAEPPEMTKIAIVNFYPNKIFNFVQTGQVLATNTTDMNKPKLTVKGKQIAILCLNLNGDLYREPKKRYCYQMGEKSYRHKIIRFLVKNTGYQMTGLISMESGNKSEKSLRTEVAKMRDNIRKYLKINGRDFLEGKKGSGYRINPKYKIILKNE